jgi:hypothetical protein
MKIETSRADRQGGWKAPVAIAALLIAGGLILFFCFRSPPGAGPDRDGAVAPADESGAPAEGVAGVAGGDLEGTAPEEEGEEAAPEEDLGPPLLRGRVTGEGEGIGGARVHLFPVARVEEAIDRLEPIASRGGAIPDIDAILKAVRGELEAIRRSAVSRSTDGTGAYEVRGAKPGSHLVLATAEGWLFRFGDVVSLSEGETRVLDLDLHRGALIAGRVVDGEGAGIPGVKVTAEFRPGGTAGLGLVVRRLLRYVNGEFLRGPFETSTNAEGAFRLTSLPPGVYDLAAEKPGAPEARLKGVEAGSAEAVIYMGKGGSARAILRDGQGEIAAGVPVRLERQDDLIQLPLPVVAFGDVANSVNRLLGEAPPVARSGVEGDLRFGPLAPGGYRLAVEERGFLPFVHTFDLGWDEDLDLGVLTVDRGGAIAGTVRTEEGAPLEGARVFISPAQANPFNMGGTMNDFFSGRTSAVSDASGSFRVAGLQRGKYRVMASLKGFAPARQNEVRTGGKAIELVLKPGRRIAGRVIEAGDEGKPIRGAKVEAAGAQAETGEGGLFVLEGVVPESPDQNPFFEVSAMPGMVPEMPAVTTVKVEASLSGYLSGEAPADLSSSDPEVEISLRKNPGISGTVLDPEGKPAAGALVRLLPEMKMVDLPPGFDFFDRSLIFLAVAVSDLEGKFRFKEFRGASEGESYQVIADHPAHARGTSEPFAILAGEEPKGEVEVRLVAAARVTGTVTDGRGGVPSALVRLSKAPAKEKGANGIEMESVFTTMLGLPKGGDTTYTSRDGAFAFERVLPGDYVIGAEKPGFTESPAQAFSLAAGETRELAMAIDPGGEIAGTVVDGEGNAIAGARVRLFQEREGGGVSDWILETQKMFGGSYRSARAGDDGSFLLSGLPKGAYTLHAEASGYLPADLKGVTPGEKKKLTLDPSASIRGVVADSASRTPIASFKVKARKEDPAAVPDVAFMMTDGKEYNDADGRFTADGLEGGKYLVTVTAKEYVPCEKKVFLAAGGVVEEEFLLVRAGRLRGTVRDLLTGRPLAGARIGLSRRRPGPAASETPAASEATPEGGEGGRKEKRSGDGKEEPPPPDPAVEDATAMGEFFEEEWSGADRATAAEDGSFVLDGIPPGPQRIVFTHPDCISETRDGIEVPLGQEVVMDFTLRIGFSVSGRVLDSIGEPAANKMVFIRGASKGNRRSSKSAMTDEQGEFRLRGLGAGTYRLFLPENVKATADGLTGQEPQVIDVDRDIAGIEIRLAEGEG